MISFPKKSQIEWNPVKLFETVSQLSTVAIKVADFARNQRLFFTFSGYFLPAKPLDPRSDPYVDSKRWNYWTKSRDSREKSQISSCKKCRFIFREVWKVKVEDSFWAITHSLFGMRQRVCYYWLRADEPGVLSCDDLPCIWPFQENRFSSMDWK